MVRGGVSIGKVHHREGIIFGPALVEAIEMEHKAYYPRYLCSEKLIAHLDREPYKHEVFFEDYCEQWAVNTAWGSIVNRNELLKVIEEEIGSRRAGGNTFRWHYMRSLLPKMYELKSIDQ